MRRTTYALPIELIEPTGPLSHAIKGRHAQGANPEPVIPLALSLISMYNNYRCEYCIPVARISGGDLDTAHVLF